MNTQSLDLNKTGLAPMQSSELQEVEGGSLLGDLAKEILVQGIYESGKWLAGQVASDWNSRTGGQASITSQTAAFGPYN